jgi:small ligand-binding sensory domain FIST
LPDPRSLCLPRQDAGTVATGFATADRATPELAAQAVRAALIRIDSSLAGSVLLFLTSHFHRNAQAAISAAARAGRCLQVAGCTAPGVLTETDWSLDAPAAAALVLCGDIGLVRPSDDGPRLTLATPVGAREQWRSDAAPRLGILATNADGETQGRVWLHGKIVVDGYCETCFSHSRMAVGVSRGIRALTPVMTVTEADGHEVFTLDGEPALATLPRELPTDKDAASPLPPHLFAALTSAPLTAEEAVARGSYRLLPILAASQEEQSLTLALALNAGDRLFWVSRQPMAAVQDTEENLAELATSMPTPDFALLFACIGRGPYFFGSEDFDLARIGERFPGLPVIGAYGVGEIAPLPEGNSLISHSAVTALVGNVQP